MPSSGDDGGRGKWTHREAVPSEKGERAVRCEVVAERDLLPSLLAPQAHLAEDVPAHARVSARPHDKSLVGVDARRETHRPVAGKEAAQPQGVDERDELGVERLDRVRARVERGAVLQLDDGAVGASERLAQSAGRRSKASGNAGRGATSEEDRAHLATMPHIRETLMSSLERRHRYVKAGEGRMTTGRSSSRGRRMVDS